MSPITTDSSNNADDCLLAREMIEVHGVEAAAVARNNARLAALAGQKPQARSWIRVLGIIQQHPIKSGNSGSRLDGRMTKITSC